MKSKNPAAVALGRKGGLKGGPARAAALTPEQRSQSARNAVNARWAKQVASRGGTIENPMRQSVPGDTSDQALASLLKRLRATVDPAEIGKLSDQIERVVFHKQLANT